MEHESLNRRGVIEAGKFDKFISKPFSHKGLKNKP
jgi:hypothetical protein